MPFFQEFREMLNDMFGTPAPGQRRDTRPQQPQQPVQQPQATNGEQIHILTQCNRTIPYVWRDSFEGPPVPIPLHIAQIMDQVGAVATGPRSGLRDQNMQTQLFNERETTISNVCESHHGLGEAVDLSVGTLPGGTQPYSHEDWHWRLPLPQPFQAHQTTVPQPVAPQPVRPVAPPQPVVPHQRTQPVRPQPTQNGGRFCTAAMAEIWGCQPGSTF